MWQLPCMVLLVAALVSVTALAADGPCDGMRRPGLVVLKSTSVEFPKEAYARQVEGTVWVRYRIDVQGRPISVWLCGSSGDPDLDSAGLRWFRESVFYAPSSAGATSLDGVYEDSYIFSLARENRRRSQDPRPEASTLKAIRAPQPVYPLDVAARGGEGEVTVVGTVNRAGRVRSIEIERASGWLQLDAAAAAALLQYEFEPQPHPIRVSRTFAFKLGSSSDSSPAVRVDRTAPP